MSANTRNLSSEHEINFTPKFFEVVAEPKTWLRAKIGDTTVVHILCKRQSFIESKMVTDFAALIFRNNFKREI